MKSPRRAVKVKLSSKAWQLLYLFSGTLSEPMTAFVRSALGASPPYSQMLGDIEIAEPFAALRRLDPAPDEMATEWDVIRALSGKPHVLSRCHIYGLPRKHPLLHYHLLLPLDWDGFYRNGETVLQLPLERHIGTVYQGQLWYHMGVTFRWPVPPELVEEIKEEQRAIVERSPGVVRVPATAGV